MSVCATRWAWKKQVGGGAKKLVLLSMADRAGEDFTCYPSITRLMADTELSRSAVIKAIGDLEKMGVIAFTGKTVGNGVKVYRLVGVTGRDEPVQNLHRPKSAPVQNIDPTRPDSAPPPVPNIDPTRPDSAPLTIIEPSIEPSRNHQSVYAQNENHDCQNSQTEPPPQTPDMGKADTLTAKQPTATQSATKATARPKLSYQPPDNLAPTDKQRERCQQLGVSADDELERFLDWALANAKGYVDWSRGFSTWVGNIGQFGGHKRPQQQPNRLDRLAALSREMGDEFGAFEPQPAGVLIHG